jgi:CBS domain-containing protein
MNEDSVRKAEKMNVGEIMSDHPACCTPDTPLGDVAQLMLDKDCGEIPVVESKDSARPVGVITDRDIVCRTVARKRNPLEMKAEDAMTKTVVCVTPDTSLEECCDIMEENQIRRLPVVDHNGDICGMVAQADIARNTPKEKAAEVLRFISQPSARAAEG